jgi:hypothetical protein
MRASRFAIGLLSVIGPIACTYAGTAVPLRGSPADIAALAGRWEGEFSSDDTRRGGTLTFTIRTDKDTAVGDVLLIPNATVPVRAADARETVHLHHVRSPELLRVTFVAVHGATVRGEIEPYIAPDCQCVVVTEFFGTVSGDTVSGTYVTRAEGLRQQGRWSMRRIIAAD